MARIPPLRLLVGLVPFALILATLALFLHTGDPLVFALGGLFACVYVLAILLVARRKRLARTGAGRAGRRRRTLRR